MRNRPSKSTRAVQAENFALADAVLRNDYDAARKQAQRVKELQAEIEKRQLQHGR